MSYVSHADLGGRSGYGPIDRGADDALFHADWEARALAVTLAMGACGSWNIDMSRSARETLPDYAQRSYYAIWIGALERLLLERGLVSRHELAAGAVRTAPLAVARVLAAADVPAALARGASTERGAAGATRPARFIAGDRVRTIATAAPHHTRLPAYARGRIGTIEQVRGRHVYADAHAQGHGEAPEWLYTVVFEVEPGVAVSIDAWEPYLEAPA